MGIERDYHQYKECCKTHQSVPWHVEIWNDESVGHVSQLAANEDDPLIQEGTIQSDAGYVREGGGKTLP